MANTKHKKRSAQATNRETYKKSYPEGAIPPQDNPADCENNKATKKWWHTRDLPMLIVTFFGVVAVLIYACYTRQQLGVMQGQLSVMQADQRPWVKVTITPTDLHWVAPGEGGNKNWLGLMSIGVNAANIGLVTYRR